MESVETKNNFHLDEPLVSSFFFGEFGWFIAYWIPHLRYLKQRVYKDREFLLMANLQFRPLITDFAKYMIDLPNEFKELGLEADCFEAPLPDSESGSLTPPNVYSEMVKFFRSTYNVDNTIEIFPPRGCSKIIDVRQMIFSRYTARKVHTDRPIITVYPRGRARANWRNVPEFVWYQVVESLRQNFKVVLIGTPDGSYLPNYQAENIINTIPYKEYDKLELTMQYICNSLITVGSQSGLTHLSLACDIPSYIIGHEKERHAVNENRLDTPTSFRYVNDYRAIDAQTIVSDINEFMEALKKNNMLGKPDHKSIIENDKQTLDELMG